MDLLQNKYYYYCRYDLGKETKKIYLGDYKNRVCRFCNRTKTEVKFKSIAHAIPELLGNKMLISNYECDECNQIFGKLESELASYLNPIRATYGIPKKKGNTTKIKTETFNITNIDDKIIFEDKYNLEKGNNNVQFNFKNRTLDFEIPRQYIPQKVFKSFIKMALSIIPEDKFDKLHIYKRFLNGELQSIPNMKLIEVFIPQTNDKELIVRISIRKDINKIYENNTIPLVIFSMRIKDFEYHINLYEDNYFGKVYANVKIDPELEWFQDSKKCVEKIYNMESTDRIKSTYKMDFAFDRCIDVTNEIRNQ